MKKFTSVLVLLAVCFSAGGCKKESTEKIQTEQTEKILAEMNAQIGLPNIVNFQQKKMMKMVYELCDSEDLICYAYIKSDYKGELIFIGKCIGYGLPFSAQYTNPSKVIHNRSGSTSYSVIPQADPNGLYMPTSSSATWLMMIDPKTNKPRVVYIEPELVVSPFLLKGSES